MAETIVSNQVATVLTGLFSIIFSFGGLANFLVLITHIEYHKILLKDSKDIFTFSLALNDFLMSTVVTTFPLSSAVKKRWTTGQYGCIVYGFTSTWIGLSSMLQLAAIAIERCYNLSQFLHYTRSKVRAVYAVLSCCVISFFASLMPLFGHSKYTFEGYGLHCSIAWERSHIWYCSFLLIFFFVFPLFSITISYIKILLVIRGMHGKAIQIWGINSSETLKTYTAHVKFTKQLMAVTFGFLIAWTPYAVISSAHVLTNVRFEKALYELPTIFAKTANVYNPIIYFFMYRSLRRRVSLVLRRMMKSVTSRKSPSAINSIIYIGKFS